MANEDYIADIKSYITAVDEKAVGGIVKHLGIALKSKDASLVACTDPSELERVRDSFVKKKLGRTEDNNNLDEVVAGVCQKMSATRNKSRVTFYYLLAEHYSQLGTFQ